MRELNAETIYESALVVDKWPAILEELAGMAGAVGGGLFTIRGNVQKWTSSEGLRRPMGALAASNVLTRIERPKLFDVGQNCFIREGDTMTDAELDAHPLYRDFLRPQGLGWSARTVVQLPTDDYIALVLERRHADGPVPLEAIQLLNGMRPHLARAALMAARLQLQRAEMAAQVLAMLGLPALVLDERRKLLAANTMGETRSEVQYQARNKIGFHDKRADELLANAVAATAVNHHAQPKSFAVSGEDGIPSLVAHVVPVCGMAQDIFSRSLVIVILTPVASSRIPSVELVQSLFDFTAAEARVARQIAQGETVEGIATNNGVSVTTVRSQLRQVLEKTGFSRQAQVAALLNGLTIVNH